MTISITGIRALAGVEYVLFVVVIPAKAGIQGGTRGRHRTSPPLDSGSGGYKGQARNDRKSSILVFQRPVRNLGKRENKDIMRFIAVRCLFALLLLTTSACGIKAPPVPRETVVPSPIRDLSVRQADDGILVDFTLPATRLDGGPLEKIAGYRLVCRGPDGTKTEQEFLFSFSQQSAMVGKKVSVPETLPPGPGIYRYTVVPLDAYGSHPREKVWVEFTRDDGRPAAGEPAVDTGQAPEGESAGQAGEK